MLPEAVRRVAAATAIAGAVTTAALVPLLVNDPSAFTWRGIVWIKTREAIGVTPLFGRGSNWFEVVGSPFERLGGAVDRHSQLLHMLVAGRLLLVLLTVPLVALAVVGALAICGMVRYGGSHLPLPSPDMASRRSRSSSGR